MTNKLPEAGKKYKFKRCEINGCQECIVIVQKVEMLPTVIYCVEEDLEKPEYFEEVRADGFFNIFEELSNQKLKETKLDECTTPELFFLVECKDYDGRIEDRLLFRTNEQAQKHIHRRNEEGLDMYAEIITLTIY